MNMITERIFDESFMGSLIRVLKILMDQQQTTNGDVIRIQDEEATLGSDRP